MTKTISSKKAINQKGSLHFIFKLLAWVNGLVAICLAFLLVLPSFIDWGQYKEKISAHAQKYLGTDIRIEGAVYAQFLPVPILKLNRVVIINGERPDRSPLLVKRADIELDFWALVRGELKPRAFLLKEAELHFGLTKNKSWLVPVGFDSFFLSKNEHLISRLGVSQGKIHLSQGPSKPGLTISNIDFTAEKTDQANNWSLRGVVKGKTSQHGFQLITRARPEQNQTFVDARIKTPAGGGVAYSFNGSVSNLPEGLQVEGRYEGSGTYGHGAHAHALSTRGQILLSNMAVNLTGATLSLAPASQEKETVVKPAIFNANIHLLRKQVSGNWKMNSDLSVENFNSDMMSALLPKDTDPIKLFQILNDFAGYFDGDATLRGKNIKSGSSVFPNSWANISFSGGLMHITGASLGLPGGGKLQTDRLQAVWQMEGGKKAIVHSGTIYLKSQTIRDLAFFLPLSMETKAFGNFSNSRHPLSLNGEVQIGAKGLRFKSDNMNVNGSAGTLMLSVRGQKFQKSDVALHIEKVNADRYFRSAKNSFVQIFTNLIKQSRRREGSAENSQSSKMRISIGNLLWQGTALKDFKLHGDISKNRLTLSKLSAGGETHEGIDLLMAGQINGLASNPSGSLQISLKSKTALDVLSLVSPDFAVSKRGRALLKHAQIVSPLSVHAKLVSSKVLEEEAGWDFHVDGRVASTQFSSDGVVVPNWDAKKHVINHLDMQVEFSNESGRVLAGQIFALEDKLVSNIPDGEGILRASLTGSSDKGFDVAFGGEISDIQTTLAGNVKLVDGKPAIAAQVKLISADSRSLLSLVGLKTKKNFGKTDYAANLAGSGSEYVLSGGHGKLWGKEARLEARLDLKPKKPHLSAHIRTNEVRPLSLQAASRLLVGKPGTSQKIFDLFNTDLSLEVPLLRFYKGMDITDARAQLKISETELFLSQLSGQLFGGSLVANGRLGRKGQDFDLAGQYELKDANLEDALRQNSRDKIATGRFTLVGEIDGKGQSLQEISRKLNGQGYMKARSGNITGINPAAFGRSVRFVTNGTELDGMIGGILTQGTLPYSQFQTAYKISNSVLKTSKTQLISRDVKSLNKTRIDLVSGSIISEWELDILRLPNTPSLQLSYEGTRRNLHRQLHHGKLRRHLMALMQNGEKLDKRFAAAKPDRKVQVDLIETGSVKKKKMMKKPIKLQNLKIVPQVNPLRGSN